MEGLKVSTEVLHASAAALSTIADAAHQIGDKHARLGEVVWAAGSDAASVGLDSFLCAWTYGVRCIAHQAGEISAHLITAAVAYEHAETSLTVAAGGVAAAPPPAVPASAWAEEPLRPVPRFVQGQLPVLLPAAKHVTELIPGDPEEVALGARMMRTFADDLFAARRELGRVSMGDWVGAAADVVRADLDDLPTRLLTAQEAFTEAGDALAAYARTHADAHEEAARALAMWQAAKPASAAAHGATTAPAVAGPADPDAVLVRAAALARDAQEQFDLAGRALRDTLKQAEEGAPKHPGLLSAIRRGLRSFGIGFAEGAAGWVEGPVMLGDAAGHLVNPLRLLADPADFGSTWWAVAKGLYHTGTHPVGLVKGAVDWDLIKENPVEGIAKLLPDLLLAAAAVTKAGALREAEATDELRRAEDVIADANKKGLSVYDDVSDDLIERRLTELRVDPASAISTELRRQLSPPFGANDQWLPVHLQPGDRILVRSDGFATLVTEDVPRDARLWSESGQLPAIRMPLGDGLISQPEYRQTVRMFEVGPDGLDTSGATALANPQFGAGGAYRVAIPDPGSYVADGRLINPKVHHFDADTFEAKFEDPRYSAANPSLPRHALNPEHERVMGQVEGAAEEARSTARGAVLGTAAASARRDEDQGAR